MYCSTCIYSQCKGTPEGNLKYLWFHLESYNEEVLFLLSLLTTEVTKAGHQPTLASYLKCLSMGSLTPPRYHWGTKMIQLAFEITEVLRIIWKVRRFCCHFLVYTHICHILFFSSPLILSSQSVLGKLHCEVKANTVQPFWVITC